MLIELLLHFECFRPGRDFAEHKIASSASSLATHSNLLAVGSWNTTISLYNINEYGTYKSIGKMHGHSGKLQQYGNIDLVLLSVHPASYPISQLYNLYIRKSTITR